MLIGDFINSIALSTQKPQQEETILTIAGIGHQENAWSRIYAYFLNEKESHGLGRLFKKSLENIVYRKTGRSVNLSGGVVRCEQSTIAGNRIDILIQAPEHSIIIENKVHHRLDNDLNDYWISVDGKDDAKTGIVVTLSKILTNNRNYINVTHLEWVDEIEELLKSRRCSTCATDTMVLLKNFLENIKQVCGKMNESDIKFYLNNREKINNLYSVASDYRSWLQSIFTDKAFIRSLGGFTLVHSDWIGCKNRFAMYRFSNTTETDEFVVTVFYETLWNSKPGEARLSLFLQALGGWAKKAIDEENSIREIASACGVPSRERHKDFWHCAAVEIAVPDEDLLSEDALKGYIIKHLTGFISDKGLLAAANKIMERLSNKHLPTYRWNDVIIRLKGLIPEDDYDNKTFWNADIQFIAYDPQTKIIVLEVGNNYVRCDIEHTYYTELISAVKYVYGDDVRVSIMCRNFLD